MLANNEAAEMEIEQVAHPRERGGCCENRNRGLPYVRCNKPISRRVMASHTPGCMVMCEEHWLASHASDGSGETFEEIVEFYRSAAEKSGPCAVCGVRTRQWISGAGAYLCSRHQDDY